MNENKPSRFSAFWFYAGLALILFFILNPLSSSGLWKQPEEIPQTEFEKFLQDGDISRVVVVNKHQARIYLFPEAMEKPDHKKVRAESPLFKAGADSDVPQYKMEVGVLENFENRFNKIVAENNLSNTQLIYKTEQNFLGDLLITVVLPLVLFVGLWIFLMRRAGGGMGGGQFFNIGRSRAKLFDGEKDKKITFQDVAGLEGAKEEVQEIVDFLKNPEKYTSLGGKIPKGALLVGPPGTGTTLLAKAVAGEAQVPFFSLSGSDFVEMFVGVGASRVRDLFRQAKEKSPSIIFIDEIDAIGRARGKNNLTNANDERENTLNQLLTEMDGFGTTTNVIVLAATNRADILDKALLRAGRFDRQIYVDLPDLNERKEIFKVHLRPIKITENLDIEFLAKQTPGFSGADIANVCNEAALIAARRGKASVDKQDFLDAVDRIIGGLEKKNKIITPEEKKAIAYHEAGHATVSWLLEHAAPLVKVTIVPRGRSLGAAWYLPEERQIVRTDQIQDEMCAALGGRASEEITFGKISTGALSDLEKVTKQARAMVTIYGLNEKIGNLTYYDPTGEEYGFTKPYSEKTAQVIDEEISNIIEQQYQRALAILRANQDKLTTLAELLLEREVIFKEDLENIFGKRPHEEKYFFYLFIFLPLILEFVSESSAENFSYLESLNSVIIIDSLESKVG